MPLEAPQQNNAQPPTEERLVSIIPLAVEGTLRRQALEAEIASADAQLEISNALLQAQLDFAQSMVGLDAAAAALYRAFHPKG